VIQIAEPARTLACAMEDRGLPGLIVHIGSPTLLDAVVPVPTLLVIYPRIE